jgi:hypothetical protein
VDFAMADPLRYTRATGLFFVFMVIVALIVALRDRRLRTEAVRDPDTAVV